MTDPAEQIQDLLDWREDLFDLRLRLESAGINVSPAQLLDAHNLLLGLRLGGKLPRKIAAWCGLLAPIFCHSAHEQERFYGIFQEWAAHSTARTSRSRRLRRHLKGLGEALAGVIPELESRLDGARQRLLAVGLNLDSANARRQALPLLAEALCQSDGERRLLDRACRPWIKAIQIEPDAIASREDSRTAREPTRHARSWKPTGRTAVLSLIAGLLLALAIRQWWPVGQTEPVKPPVVESTRPPAESSPKITPATDAEKQLLPSRPLEIVPPQFHGWNGREIRLGFAALPWVPLLVWLMLGYLARRPVITRGPGESVGDPHIRWVEGTDAEFFDPEDLRIAAGRLREPQFRLSRRIDAVRTVLATVHKGGFYTPVQQRRRHHPEYLVLMDRSRSPGRAANAAIPPVERDHLTALGAAMLRQLRSEQIIAHLYHFDGDPRLCQAEDGPSISCDLKTLAARHGDCRLVLFSDGAGLFEFLSGRPAPWLGDFDSWPQRILLTPKSFDEWGYPEATLALAGFAVAPAHPKSLALLAEVWLPKALREDLPESAMLQVRMLAPVASHATANELPERIRRYGDRWLEYLPPDHGTVRDLLGQLEHYLGPQGFVLLQAVAVYPEITWPLTLYLDHSVLGTEERCGRAARMLSLARLPWLRHGKMPDYLRLALIRSLPRPRHRTISRLFLHLLDSIGKQGPNAIAIRLEPPPDRTLLERLKALFLGPHPAVGDRIFAKMMLGGSPGLLDVEVPRMLASWLPGIAWNDALVRVVAGSAAALLLGAVLFAGAGLADDALNAWLMERQQAYHGSVQLRVVRSSAANWQESPLVDALFGAGFKPRLDVLPAGADKTAIPPNDSVQAGSDAIAAGRWVAARLRYLNYGREVLLYSPDDAEKTSPASAVAADNEVIVRLADVPQIFQDKLSDFAMLPGYTLLQAIRRGGHLDLQIQTADASGKTIEYACRCSGAADGEQWSQMPLQSRPLLPAATAKCPPTAKPIGCDVPGAKEITYIEPEMVEIPAGQFTMGSPASEKDRAEDEGPQHKVNIAKFSLGVNEVTFDEYDAFAEATGREKPDDSGWGRGHRPVINVSWDDAQAYATWLSEKTGKPYRLPTEAEWEYAARGKTQTAYWWGNDVKQGGKAWANCMGCGSDWDNNQTAPVGSFQANAFGLHDTAGNVWEWVQDCYHDSYKNAPTDGKAWEDKKGCDSGGRVLRGGSWSFNPDWVRSATRNTRPPGSRYSSIGFRLARTL